MKKFTLDAADSHIHGLVIDQKEIDWQQKPPTLSGTINGVAWQAQFLLEDWSVFDSYELTQSEVITIEQYLFNITAEVENRQKKTRILQCVILGVVAAGVLTGAITAYYYWRNRKKETS